MKRYDSYKDSGVKWLGEIPSHWDSASLLYLLRAKISDGPHETPNLIEDGIPFISIDSLNDTKEIDFSVVKKFISYKDYERYCYKTKLEKGDVLFSKAATIGKTAIVGDGVFMVWSPLAILKPNLDKISSLYLYYIMNCKKAIEEVSLSGSKNTQINVGMRELEKIRIPIPSIEEQSKITYFLENETSKIDEAIAQQQKMIDLLNERKQIIINNAVTKGLNTNVPMKVSGVDWIGEIPEHWEIKRGKFLFDIINEYSSTGEEELLTVSDRTGITPRSMKNVTMFMAESLVGYKKCKIGDICSNIMWMWHGAVGVTKYDGVISPSYGVYRQKKLYYNGDYLDMLLRLPQLVKFYASRSTGLTESRLRLYPDDFLNICFFVPPMEEQEMIVNRLKTICKPIESAIDAATQQISLLQERKQIIINDVVTGKVKVV